MNVLISIISLVAALELRTLVYLNKLYVHPAKQTNNKIYRGYEIERNVGLGVRLKQFVLRPEHHLTVNDFWRVLGKSSEQLTNKNHILRLMDDNLRIRPFHTPIDSVTIFSIILDALNLPEGCHIFLVVDDLDIKEIAQSAVQAFTNVNLKLQYILPKTLVLALDELVKKRIKKRYLLVIDTSGKRSVFSFYTTNKGKKGRKAGKENDQNSKIAGKNERKADSKSKEDEILNWNEGYTIKFAFAHETEIISDITITNMIYEFIRKTVEDAYNKFRTKDRNLEPVEMGYYPFDYDRKRPDYYFYAEDILMDMLQPIQTGAKSYTRTEVLIHNSNGASIAVLTFQEFDLNDLHRKLNRYRDKNNTTMSSFEDNLVNKMLEIMNDRKIAPKNLLKHIDVICHGMAMELSFVKEYFSVLKVKTRHFLSRYGSGGNHYHPSKVKDDRVYEVNSIPGVNTEEYEKIMYEIKVYETAKKLANSSEKIQSDHPLVKEYEELKEKISRSDPNLTFDEYRDFAKNYEQIAYKYDTRSLKAAHAGLLEQLREIEMLKNEEPKLYRAVEHLYEGIKKWHEGLGDITETTCYELIKQRHRLKESLEAAREGRAVDEIDSKMDTEISHEERKPESVPPDQYITKRTTMPKKKRAKYVHVFKNLIYRFSRLLGIAKRRSDRVRQRDVFEEIPNKTRLERVIPRSIDPSFGSKHQYLDDSEEIENEKRYEEYEQRGYVHEEL
ncbi:hypothetical protein VCUG_00465 [Vavraia culicis subsp. floridensis]|uniref:Uncharacterized protein n=1 Tax=Vavraia culicis (isolate floridensis) TaxID=948595 RepID=L2GXG0_VAVCU|nr:uncharacterized protein VCUG_00465 [Vavraia culicis subsp. floridensis]ELA48042.1 hypothetical protein VCUG_00465 [Vavraia culicis subsp. floridensis]